MGYSISWLAVRGIPKQIAYDRMGLIPTGETGERDDFQASGRTLAGGWTVVMFGRVDHPLLRACDRLSRGCSLLACVVEEHEMMSAAAFWQDGAQLWQVMHQAERSLYDLQTEGTLPSQFGVIDLLHRARQLRDSAADVDDMFEIPLELAASITSFKHDQSRPGEDDFEELKPKRP
jgi:hypothetical protein